MLAVWRHGVAAVGPLLCCDCPTLTSRQLHSTFLSDVLSSLTLGRVSHRHMHTMAHKLVPGQHCCCCCPCWCGW